MNIDSKQTTGCDKTSRVYCDMFNMLQDIINDENKLKELSPLDYSALGMYVGKYVEQEINSSVVQIMRAFRGISMPENYCKRDPEFRGNECVKTSKKTIRLNEQNNYWDSKSLKTLPLGDAYYALEELKKEDRKGFFTHYQWLYDDVFLEAWRRLFKFRNKMAHIGEIINAEFIKENYDFFCRFLEYMPSIHEIKKNLTPNPNRDIESSYEPEDDLINYIFTDNSYSTKPFATKEIALRYLELFNNLSYDSNTTEINSIIQDYNLDAIIFEGDNGKKGMKDCLGNILVPAIYDGFGFIPKALDTKNTSVIAARDGKFVVVALDGSGHELTKQLYDDICLAPLPTYTPYVYRRNGLRSWGLMNALGEEMCGCIIDKLSMGWVDSITFESGDYLGYWQLSTQFLPPIYDNIEMPGEPWEPLMFTLNGVQGYVRVEDGSFVPKSELDKLDEDTRHDTMFDFICEQYEEG